MYFSKKALIWTILIPLLIMFFSLIVQSAETIRIEGFVNDYANVISPEYETKIEGILKNLYDTKTTEFSVVTIESLDEKDIESYALNLAQGKIGDKEKNNGLLLLVAVKERKYRFEVGRGLEPILNDAKVGRIGRDYLVENFREGEYGKGIYEATQAVEKSLKGETEDNKNLARENIIAFVAVLLFIMFIILIFVVPFILRIKEYKKRKRNNDYFDAALLAALLFGRRGHGGFSGGGFGGGGFGGGGSFGGGGASGGW